MKRRSRSLWLVLGGLAGLFLLTACGGSSSAAIPTDTPAATTVAPAKSTISFTASGGLTGATTITDNGRGSNFGSNSLGLIVSDDTWNFTLSLSPYTGPASYTFTTSQSSSAFGTVGLASKDLSKSWQLAAPATCQATVTGDDAIKETDGSVRYHEIKGTFACKSLTAQTPAGGAALAISDGQFDIIALVVQS